MCVCVCVRARACVFFPAKSVHSYSHYIRSSHSVTQSTIRQTNNTGARTGIQGLPTRPEGEGMGAGGGVRGGGVCVCVCVGGGGG